MTTPVNDRSDASGQFMTAGIAVASLGGLGLAIAGISKFASVELPNVDLIGMAITSLLLMATGGMMVETGRHDEGA
jgi:hypothetical protein